MGADLQ